MRIFGELRLSYLRIQSRKIVLIIIGGERLIRSSQRIVCPRSMCGFNRLPQPFIYIPELAAQVTTSLDRTVDRRDSVLISISCCLVALKLFF